MNETENNVTEDVTANENRRRHDFTVWMRKFFPIPFPNIDKELRDKISQLFGISFVATLVLLLLCLQLRTVGMLAMALFVVAFGAINCLEIYYFASNNRIKKIDGVIIRISEIGNSVTGKRRKYLIQIPNGNVYQLIVSKKNDYIEGDIVHVYFRSDYNKNIRDGVHILPGFYSFTRLEAKVTTDEQDEELRKMEEGENL